MRSGVSIAVFAGSLLFGTVASANIEAPPSDGRSAALGDSGAALAHNSTAAYFNPAALDGIGSVSVTLRYSPVFPRISAPFVTGDISAKSSMASLFFGGAAFRLHERLVLGVAVYPTAGGGATYELPAAAGGGELSSAAGVLEAAIPLSVRILPGFSLGVAWRGTLVVQSAHIPGAPPVGTTDLSLSGKNLGGFSVGAHYEPVPGIAFGLSYRSRVSVGLSGTSGNDLGDFATTSTFASPQSIRLGTALSFASLVTIAADLRWFNYASSNQAFTTTVELPAALGGPVSQVTTQDWKDSVGFGLGVELKVAPFLVARIGDSITTSATPEARASMMGIAPGLINRFALGLGLGFGPLSIDLAGSYLAVGSTVPANLPNGVLPGRYATSVVQGTLSATYQM